MKQAPIVEDSFSLTSESPISRKDQKQNKIWRGPTRGLFSSPWALGRLADREISDAVLNSTIGNADRSSEERRRLAGRRKSVIGKMHKFDEKINIC